MPRSQQANHVGCYIRYIVVRHYQGSKHCKVPNLHTPTLPTRQTRLPTPRDVWMRVAPPLFIPRKLRLWRGVHPWIVDVASWLVALAGLCSDATLSQLRRGSVEIAAVFASGRLACGLKPQLPVQSQYLLRHSPRSIPDLLCSRSWAFGVALATSGRANTPRQCRDLPRGSSLRHDPR